jgi:hypothetical protein
MIRMGRISVQAGRDHLGQFQRRAPVEALAELVWNALDADAETISVTVNTASTVVGDRRVPRVTSVVVTDDGIGITPEVARDTFGSLGDSWRLGQGGRTPHGHRALHGSLGRGRFLAYALGREVTWSSVSRSAGGVNEGLKSGAVRAPDRASQRCMRMS